MTADEAQTILAERARLLAIPPAIDHVRDEVELVVFILDGERYALEPRSVREVLRAPEIARLPATEPPVLGLTAWHGELLTIIAVGQHSGLPPRSDDESRGFLVVLAREGAGYGILVDRIEGFISLDAAKLREAALTVLDAAELVPGPNLKEDTP
jgi:chemotaxis signal transduction protein